MVGDPRIRAKTALAGGVVALCAPTLTARLSETGVTSAEVVRAELAGSGSAVLQVTGGDPLVLATHRRLAVLDNAYVVAYTVPLLLGVSLLSPPWRALGLGLTGLTAVADLTENAALVRALGILASDPTEPLAADLPARRARRAALAKFAALIPAAGLAVAGTSRTLRQDPDHL